MAGDNANFWKDIELRIYLNPFSKSCQIYSTLEKARSKNPLKPKATFKWVFMDVIPAIAPKWLTCETTSSQNLLIAHALSKIPKLYGMDKITKEEVMDKLDMFQSRFGKID